MPGDSMMEPATAKDYLREIARSGDGVRSQIAQGIFWADESCRISGTLSLALRDADVEGGRLLLELMAAQGLTTQAEVPRFLNRFYFTCLNLLGPVEG
jgi:hypothetical protein